MKKVPQANVSASIDKVLKGTSERNLPKLKECPEALNKVVAYTVVFREVYFINVFQCHIFEG